MVLLLSLARLSMLNPPCSQSALVNQPELHKHRKGVAQPLVRNTARFTVNHFCKTRLFFQSSLRCFTTALLKVTEHISDSLPAIAIRTGAWSGRGKRQKDKLSGKGFIFQTPTQGSTVHPAFLGWEKQQRNVCQESRVSKRSHKAPFGNNFSWQAKPVHALVKLMAPQQPLPGARAHRSIINTICRGFLG